MAIFWAGPPNYIVVFNGAYLVLEAEADMLSVVDGLHCTLEC